MLPIVQWMVDATSTSNPLIINPKCINAFEKDWKYDNYQSEAM